MLFTLPHQLQMLLFSHPVLSHVPSSQSHVPLSHFSLISPEQVLFLICRAQSKTFELDWLVGWLVGWWLGGWVGWLVGWWLGGWVGWLVGWLSVWLAD